MKTIKIKSLSLTNFKGIRSLELNELSKETSVYGDNGVGKTTLFDSFTWLLFGKDSTDRTTFEVKTLDANNNVIPKIDHIVEAELIVDGVEVELRKTLREKWVTKKGSLDPEFSGNVTIYEWNGVPMNQRDYTAKINDIVDEKVFKMITNPAAFNALKWTEQRDVLITLSGSITDEVIAAGNLEFQELIKSLKGKSFDEYKKQLRASILKSKKELQTIPTRIDEVERSKPDTSEFKGDFNLLRSNLIVIEDQIEDVNNQVSDKLQAQQSDLDAQKQIQQDIYDIEKEVSETKHKLQQEASALHNESQSKPRDIERKISAIDSDIKANEQSISSNKNLINSYTSQKDSLTKTMASLREEWEQVNARTFKMDENECVCPTCKREFDSSNIEEKRKDLEEHFTSNKQADLKRINEKGQSYKGQKLTLENNIKDLQKDLEIKESENKTLWEKRADLSEQLKSLSSGKTMTEIYNELLKDNEDLFNTKANEISQKKQELSNRPQVDTSELKSKIETLKAKRDAIKKDLQKEEMIANANKRIEQLSKEESELAQSIADMEREMFTIEAFEKEKSTRIEASVNDKFQMVNFKLFETQINGGEVPTCKALINGVPFSDANTASKINAGLDIINTLCEHYQVNAPIFIDNRESVIELLDTQSQVINLIVSEGDTKLRVVKMQEEFQTV